MKMFINSDMTHYDLQECLNNTMTIGQLIDYLQDNYSDDDKIYLRNDNGYSYTAITESTIECKQ
jgi:hypothetical protein